MLDLKANKIVELTLQKEGSIMKLLMIITLIFLISCSNQDDYGKFLDGAIDFYVLMLQNGEQNEELNEVYKEFKQHQYKNEPLYINVIKMYEAFGNGEDAEVYRYEVTKLINEL